VVGVTVDVGCCAVVVVVLEGHDDRHVVQFIIACVVVAHNIVVNIVCRIILGCFVLVLYYSTARSVRATLRSPHSLLLFQQWVTCTCSLLYSPLCLSNCFVVLILSLFHQNNNTNYF
jgi:hypothetical protein